MGKPFRIVEQGKGPVALVGRDSNGQFKRIEAQTPDELKAEARERGVMVQDIAKLRQAPDTSTASENTSSEVGQAASYDPALPWPPATFNDSNRAPFKRLK